MRKLGIRGASRATKRFTTRSDPGAVRAPDLLHRDFTATRPDATWVSDFTYCSTWSGIVYVAFVVDVFSRRIVGWKAAPHHGDAVAERFFSSLKAELIHRQSWATRAQARRAIVDYIEIFFNRRRFHSSLGYLSPAEYEARRIHHHRAAQAA